jgi:type II secretory pathway predicted ATPase ExeA
MFLDFYQLKEQPFGVTPDPHFLYLGVSHREALASLSYGVKMGRGLLALIAPPGMGKTTLLFRLLEHLRGTARTAFLFQTQCDSSGLLRYLLADLGVNACGNDFVTMHEQLNEQLLREAKVGRRFVLVIDEAQNLNDSVLETARLLTDFETPREKLLQIVFAGQPQLAEKLEQPELAQLRQRIAILGRLEPFGNTEISQYIDHRLHVAGYNAGPLFTPAAIARIAASSEGIPRNINNLCFNALSLGCALRRKQIDADLVGEAVSDLDMSSLAAERRRELQEAASPVPVILREPAVELVTNVGAEAVSHLVDTGESAPIEELSIRNEDSPQTSLSFDDLRVAFLAGDGTEVLRLESLEHAQERQAEILAEIVSSDTLGGANHTMQPKDNEEAADLVTKLASKDLEPIHVDTPYLDPHFSPALIGDLVEVTALHSAAGSTCPSMVSMTVHARGGADGGDAGARLPLYCTEKSPRLERLGVFASAFVLVLLAALPIQEDVKVAATETRSSIAAAAASPSSYRSAVNTVPATLPTTLGPTLGEKPKLSEGSVVAAVSGAALKTSHIATQVGAREVATRGRESGAAIKFRAAHPRLPQPTSTITVTVQPHDDLRQICLRYLGSYTARLVSQINELNPGLIDDNRLAVGQRVVLPGSIAVAASVSISGSVPRP